MTLTDFTINSLKEFISGDNELTPYLSGPKIIKLFNGVGVKEMYEKSGMPRNESRNEYINTTLKDLNGTKNIVKVFELLFDPRHFVADPTKDINEAVEKINPLLQQDGYKLEDIDGKFKIIGSDLPEEIEVEIHFEEIQAQIIEQIRNAKFSIWVAVAWFADKVIARELYNKKREGLNVRIVVLDDEINKKYGIDYEKHFDAKRVPKEGVFENIMHHKFCVIDLKTVIHGSYNWTNKARWNKETISIDNSRELAEKFATQFIELNK